MTLLLPFRLSVSTEGERNLDDEAVEAFGESKLAIIVVSGSETTPRS